MSVLSILTPAFNEAANLEAVYARLTVAMQVHDMDWEWVIVDDHSRDDTFGVVERLAAADERVRGIRLSRNSGSHVAITCGLHQVRGDAAVMMAADLQDPPEVIGAMLKEWRKGARVVWATRRVRPGEPAHAGFAAIYYWIMRRVVGMTEMPERGADFFLIDRLAIEAFRHCDERNVSVLALITWLGFPQAVIEYDKQPRAAGRSGWTLARKVKLVVDSVTAFSDLPVRLCAYGGTVLLVAGVVGMVAGVATASGSGWLAFAGLVVTMTGVQLLGLGIVGMYVWRGLDEARGRPAYFVERLAGRHPGDSARWQDGIK